jgi:hypothetical protein
VTPTREPSTPGYVKAKELPDGTIPSPKEDGNFIIGPTHSAAPEMTANQSVPKGDVFEFTMESKDSKIYPGIAREPNTFAVPDPANPNKVIVNSYPAPYTRRVANAGPTSLKLSTHCGTFLLSLTFTKLKCVLQQNLFAISKHGFSGLAYHPLVFPQYTAGYSLPVYRRIRSGPSFEAILQQ